MPMAPHIWQQLTVDLSSALVRTGLMRRAALA
jgi:hypothetical protein